MCTLYETPTKTPGLSFAVGSYSLAFYFRASIVAALLCLRDLRPVVCMAAYKSAPWYPTRGRAQSPSSAADLRGRRRFFNPRKRTNLVRYGFA